MTALLELDQVTAGYGESIVLDGISLALAEADALAILGRTIEARALFDKIMSYRNRFGLFSEDVDPKTGELWGNFPQTYSLVGIIISAMRLSRGWENGR